ncbi:carboxymuconolactone decarboxylase family protein [uncultured Maribacter sp.]|uniref:carboxymuconolactone decarboxylase family protein n=1 Tax=uncultured Maribacter sp. TaxID=431308 RepID=UPI0026070D18|nr:carboxymuconolactone decarboxylase family protein [uncultured Maribacter sp.]
MSRIDPIANPKESELGSLFSNAEKWMGFLPNDGLIMAHKPEVLKSFFLLAKAVYEEGKVNAGLKRMIGHLSSKVSGCQYCSAHTAYGANEQGVEKEKLEKLWEYKTSPIFSEAEKAALNIAVNGSMVPNQTTDADFIELKKHYDSEAIVEIVGVISMFGFLNRWNATLDTQIEDAPETFYKSLNSK